MKLLVTIPGIGDNHFEEKKIFLKRNIEIIKSTFNGDVDFLLFNYSDNDFNEFEDLKIVKETGIIGQFIFKKLEPKTLESYDYIILMLDDIELSNNFNIDEMVEVYNNNNLNILSPSLTKDSKYSYSFMLENDSFKGYLRITNFCEYFFYFMDVNSYNKYWSLFDENTYWLWGIDLCLDNQGFKMGILNDFKIKHYYISESYNSNLPSPYIEMYEKEKRFGKIEEKLNIEKIESVEKSINFSNKNKKIVIFGKGPTFKIREKKEDEIYVCINDSINFVENPDIIVFNDIEAINKIKLNKLINLKKIVIPFYPHVKGYPNVNITHIDIKETLKDCFNGEYYVYNLKSSKPEKGFNIFNSYLTSSNTAAEWAIKEGYKEIITYGIGGNGYNELFGNFNSNYDTTKIVYDIKIQCQENNIKLEIR